MIHYEHMLFCVMIAVFFSVHPTFAPIRVRLSASLATGLLGLKENGFLGTFFECLNFLPLACERCAVLVIA